MSWIQDNKVPAAILGVSGAGVIGLGVLLYTAYGSYSDSLATFDTVNASLATLKGAPLAPTQQNLAAKKALVDEYQAAAGKLNLVLTKLQVPDQPTTDTDFQAKLKAKIADAKKKAAELKVGLPAEFNLAFDKYTSELPKSNEVATELSGYLNAVDEIVRLLMVSGIRRIDVLERSDLPSESDAAPAPKAPARQAQAQRTPPAGRPGTPGRATAAPVAEKATTAHQVRVVLTADQAALQLIISKLANPSDMPEMPYFPVLRLLRIENERQDGPLRSEMAAATAGPIDPVTGMPATAKQPASQTPTAEGAAPAAQSNVIPTATPAPPDSVPVLGKEGIRAFLEIDLVKFLQPAAPAAPAATPQRTR